MTFNPANTIPNLTAEVQQEEGRDWSLEEGQTIGTVFRGKYTDLLALYNQYVDDALGGSPDVASLSLRVTNGRATLTVKSVDQSYTGGGGGGGEYVVGVEELYPIDVTKDVAAAPRYESLSSDQIVKVKKAITQELDAEATDQSFDGEEELDKVLMYELWKRYAHGESSYLETGYIFRRTYITKSDLTVLTLLGTVNRVIENETLTATLNAKTAAIINALPTGEWLVRTPEIQFLGKGKYHVKEEYQWALKWSDLYGGSLEYS